MEKTVSNLLQNRHHPLYGLDFKVQCERLCAFRDYQITALGLYGLSSAYTAEDLKKAYKQLARYFHPDRHRQQKALATEAFKVIQDAHAYLQFGLKKTYEKMFTMEQIRNNPFYSASFTSVNGSYAEPSSSTHTPSARPSNQPKTLEQMTYKEIIERVRKHKDQSPYMRPSLDDDEKAAVKDLIEKDPTLLRHSFDAASTSYYSNIRWVDNKFDFWRSAFLRRAYYCEHENLFSHINSQEDIPLFNWLMARKPKDAVIASIEYLSAAVEASLFRHIVNYFRRNQPLSEQDFNYLIIALIREDRPLNLDILLDAYPEYRVTDKSDEPIKSRAVLRHLLGRRALPRLELVLQTAMTDAYSEVVCELLDSDRDFDLTNALNLIYQSRAKYCDKALFISLFKRIDLEDAGNFSQVMTIIREQHLDLIWTISLAIAETKLSIAKKREIYHGTLLRFASAAVEKEMVAALLALDAALEQKDSLLCYKASPYQALNVYLLRARYLDENPELLRYLVSFGGEQLSYCNVDYNFFRPKDRNRELVGFTPLHLACHERKIEAAIALIDKMVEQGLSLDTVCFYGHKKERGSEKGYFIRLHSHHFTALHLAINQGLDEVVHHLIAKGADVTKPCKVYHCLFDVIDFRYFTSSVKTPAELAFTLKRLSLARVLLQKEVDDYISQRQKEGRYLTQFRFFGCQLAHFGYSREAKLGAAHSLKEALAGRWVNKDFMLQTHPSFSQGRLGKIANLAFKLQALEAAQSPRPAFSYPVYPSY